MKHIDKTDLGTAQEVIQGINKKLQKQGNYNNLNDYFNEYRAKFRSCFRIEDSKLNFKQLTKDDSFRPFPIDKWKWYNDDGKTDTFLKLAQKMNLINEYAALYSTTSDDVHSDGLQHQLKYAKHSLTVYESYDPNMLVCFRAGIMELLSILQKHTVNNAKKREIGSLMTSTALIYKMNYGRKHK